MNTKSINLAPLVSFLDPIQGTIEPKNRGGGKNNFAPFLELFSWKTTPQKAPFWSFLLLIGPILHPLALSFIAPMINSKVLMWLLGFWWVNLYMILLAVWLLIDTIVPSQYGRSFQPWKAYDSPGSNIQEMSKKNAEIHSGRSSKYRWYNFRGTRSLKGRNHTDSLYLKYLPTFVETNSKPISRLAIKFTLRQTSH